MMNGVKWGQSKNLHQFLASYIEIGGCKFLL